MLDQQAVNILYQAGFCPPLKKSLSGFCPFSHKRCISYVLGQSANNDF